MESVCTVQCVNLTTVVRRPVTLEASSGDGTLVKSVSAQPVPVNQPSSSSSHSSYPPSQVSSFVRFGCLVCFVFCYFSVLAKYSVLKC